MKKPKYQVRDWVVYEFEIAMIKAMDENKIQEVSTGTISTSGHELNSQCYPLTLASKVIAEYYKHYSDKLHSLKAHLNMPDIHRHIVRLWIAGMECHLDKNEAGLIAKENQLKDFYQEVESIVNDKTNITVDGVRIFIR